MSLNKKGIYLALGSMSFLIVSGVGVSAIDSYQVQVKLDEEQIELENKRNALELSRKNALTAKLKGINPNYIDYAYDSSIVWDKLADKNYKHDEKIVFLTFDDSLSSNTESILEILQENDIKATFFVLGKQIENGGDDAKRLLREIYESGHSIGNHTYSQSSKVLYPRSRVNLDNFINELDKTQELMRDALGNPDYKTRIFRAPGGLNCWKNSQTLKNYALANDMYPIDWNASNKDSEGKKKTTEQLVNESIKSSEDKDMVVLLMHDSDGKENTVEALPEIIQWYKDNGYTFKTLG